MVALGADLAPLREGITGSSGVFKTETSLKNVLKSFLSSSRMVVQ
jgi:hypothetical protein